MDDTDDSLERRPATLAWAVLATLAAAKLLVHFASNGNYGFHRDELYYIDCGRHVAFGYVDHPPLTPLVAVLTRSWFGESLFALRLFPAMAGAAVVVLSVLLAQRLGGGGFAQALSGAAVLVTPRYLHANGMLQPVSFDQLFWVLGAFWFVILSQKNDARYWLLVGLTVGVGLLNKYTMGFFALGLGGGLLLTPARRWFANRWLWAGAAVAAVVVLPNIVWQIRHDWPTLEFLRVIHAKRMVDVSPLEFVYGGQILSQGFLTAPVWIAGLYFYLRGDAGRPYRALGWAYVVVLSVFLIGKAKPYYLGPAYPMLLAAGAVWIERQARWVRRPLAATTVVAVFLLAAAATLPRWALPIHPVDKTASGDYKDMVGWEEMVSSVASVYRGLSPQEQRDCLVFTGNYGQAGAINVLGRQHGLPAAISGHNSHWIWGPGDREPSVFIELGAGNIDNLRPHYRDVRLAGHITNALGVDNEEYQQPFYVCRGPYKTLREVWDNVKHYD